jgi:transcriptional regulator PpsR
MSLPNEPPTNLNGLSDWAPELAKTFVNLSSDIALVLDDDGVIQQVAQGSSATLAQTAHQWVGRAWIDTVTGETRNKVTQLLKEVTSTGLARRREINHPTGEGGNLAVAYTAIRLGVNGPLLAVGRDLAAISAIQQRFLGAQQEMERSYWQARQAESRYRVLFQVATDAILVADAETFEILDANQAAAKLFDMPVEQIIRRHAAFGFERHSHDAINELLVNAQTSAYGSGQQADIRVRLLGKISATNMSATPIRADDAVRLLIRVRTMDMPGAVANLNTTLARLVDSANDGIVVTDSFGRIQMANPAFLKLAQMGSEAEVKGRPLMDWVSVTDEQFASILAQVRGHGIAQRIQSQLLCSNAVINPVEFSCALLTEGAQECIGFTIKSIATVANEVAHEPDALQLALSQLCANVGNLPLPELIRQGALLLERNFVRLAMAQTNADPSAAASLLGVEQDQLGLPTKDVGTELPASSKPGSI